MYKSNNSIHCKLCPVRMLSVFCEVGDTDLNSLNSEKNCIRFGKRQTVFQKGQVAHGIYVIYSGKVKLYQLNENGREQIVRLKKTGDIIGYRSFLCGEVYSSTAETLEESSICFIKRDMLAGMMQRNPSIKTNLINLLAEDLKRAEDNLTAMVQSSVKKRMARVLLNLKESFGEGQEEGPIQIILKREELANLAGITTETAIRVLSGFKKGKIIASIGKQITLLNEKKLMEISSMS